MADMDEDSSPYPTQTQTQPPSHDHEHDLSEETQDFRFLSSIVSSSSSSTNANANATIPKRGEKDFEPNATSAQATVLASSRDAMHAALSHPRLHQARNHVVAQLVPSSPSPRSSSPFGPAYAVQVPNAHGVYFRTLGRADARNRMWLLPEEALYLLERGSLDIRWPRERERDTGSDEEVDVDEEVGEEEDGDEPIGELPMSLQGAYATFIGKSGLTLERYSVFSGLRRLGYTVIRAPTWGAEDADTNGHVAPPTQQEQSLALSRTDDEARASEGSGVLGLINRLVRYLLLPSTSSTNAACPSFGPLVAPGLYRSYNDIYRALTLIPFNDPTPNSQPHPTNPPTTQPDPAPQSPFRITYHVYKPSTAYRKSNPPAPDFRVAVIDARETHVPTMEQIGALLDSMPADELAKEKPLEQRLKHGRRNVVLAVVDMGVVSYLRFSEAGFGGEKLFENKSRNARKWKKGGQRGKNGGGGGGAKKT